jgi:hypothetical protein
MSAIGRESIGNERAKSFNKAKQLKNNDLSNS